MKSLHQHSMKKFFSLYKQLKRFSLLGVLFFSILFFIISYGIRCSTKKKLEQKDYSLVKETISQLFGSPKNSSLVVTEIIERALKKYPNLSEEYQNPLTNLYLIQGNKEKALELFYSTTMKTEVSFEKEVLAINNEVTKLYLENNLKEALEKALCLHSLLKNNKEKFPTLFSLNLFRLFSITSKLNIQDKGLFTQEIINDPTCNKIFKLFSEGECSIKKFLKI